MPTGVDSLSFPAVQTYSSGEEVAWIDPPNPDGSEPDRPAPTLQLVAATSEGGSTETTVAVGTSEPATTDASTAEEDEDSDHSNTLAVVALMIGGVALVARDRSDRHVTKARDVPTPTAGGF